MSTLLYVKGSIFGDHGQSSQLADKLIANWKSKNPQGQVVVRDLAADVPPYLDAARITALMTPEADRTSEQQAMVAYADNLIREVNEASAIVIGVPMYNFAVPAQLKSYLDYLARAGVTFKYTETGPVGLIANKPVYIVAARGGLYAGTPADSQTPFLTTFLGFIGLKDVRFIYAEGLSMGDESKAAALSKAEAAIAELV